ncbi:hypothetical protein L2748_00805, partial [Shewanella sairae]|uniref:hypothetical protein n=1 Tax=Shewanella sairae TaxID=190310 RepID=UPI00200E7D38
QFKSAKTTNLKRKSLPCVGFFVSAENDMASNKNLNRHQFMQFKSAKTTNLKRKSLPCVGFFVSAENDMASYKKP